MPVPASIPGKAHKPGWSPATPYKTPDDRMPLSFVGDPGVRPELGLKAVIPFHEPQPSVSEIHGQSPVPSAASAHPNGDGLRKGDVPRTANGRFASDPGKFPARVPR
jgi:hypothetical protein